MDSSLHQGIENDDFEDIFNIFILDYLQKSNLDETAQTFFVETMKEYYEPPIDASVPFFSTWWETFWDTAAFGKNIREAHLPPQSLASRGSNFMQDGMRPQQKMPSSLFNNMFLPNYFSIDREKAIANFNNMPPLLQPPSNNVYQDTRFPYPPVFPNTNEMPTQMHQPNMQPTFQPNPYFMGQQSSGQRAPPPPMQPEQLFNVSPTPFSFLGDPTTSNGGPLRNTLQANMKKEELDGNTTGQMEHSNPVLARAIVKNGKKCFERVKHNRKASISKQEVAAGKLFDFDGDKNGLDDGAGGSGGKGANKSRASQYRGVSRNGNQWQAIIMVHNKKRYIGSYSYETDAARAYDKAALQFHGEKAKTNYTYTVDEISSIRSEEPVLGHL